MTQQERARRAERDPAPREVLIERVRTVLQGRKGIEERRMFGGLSFLVGGNMACGVTGDAELVVRVGNETAAELSKRRHARICDFTGTPLKSMLTVSPPGTRRADALRGWVEAGVEYAGSLPRKSRQARPREKPPAR